MQVTRRKFLTISAAAVASLAIGTTSYLYISDESQHLVVDYIELPIADLPPALDGFTIAQLSDIHLYPYTQLDLVRQSVAITNALQPDVTVLTGDYVWRDLDAVFDLAPVLGQLDARHGVYAIIGNHDIWLDVDVVTSGPGKGGHPRPGESGRDVKRGGGKLVSGRPGRRLERTARPGNDARRKARRRARCLLLHEPDLADVYSQDSRIAVHLAGHTHGGQVRINDQALILPIWAKSTILACTM